MRRFLVGFGIAVALVSFIPTSLALTAEEEEKAAGVVRGLFQGAIELSTMPHNQARWDKQFALLANIFTLLTQRMDPMFLAKIGTWQHKRTRTSLTE